MSISLYKDLWLNADRGGMEEWKYANELFGMTVEEDNDY
jgi:hypothetical protein